MFTYTPFKRGSISPEKQEVSAVAHPGYLIGIYMKFFTIQNGEDISKIIISVSDIGATEAYLVKDAPITEFLCGSTLNYVDKPTNPIFVFLDHPVENDHKVILKAKTYKTNMSLYGTFIYQQ